MQIDASGHEMVDVSDFFNLGYDVFLATWFGEEDEMLGSSYKKSPNGLFFTDQERVALHFMIPSLDESKILVKLADLGYELDCLFPGKLHYMDVARGDGAFLWAQMEGSFEDWRDFFAAKIKAGEHSLTRVA